MDTQEFIRILEKRFHAHAERHPNIAWHELEKALLQSPQLAVLVKMEEAGGEVDVVKEDDELFWFFDCAAEVPAGRRSVCYDEAAREARKTHKPESSAQSLAQEIGANMLDEQDYRYLQTLGDFDQKSQSWLQTEDAFRAKGDALFGNKRHGRTFVYYNGAQSYYGIRGFRCKLGIAKAEQ